MTFPASSMVISLSGVTTFLPLRYTLKRARNRRWSTRQISTFGVRHPRDMRPPTQNLKKERERSWPLPMTKTHDGWKILSNRSYASIWSFSPAYSRNILNRMEALFTRPRYGKGLFSFSFAAPSAFLTMDESFWLQSQRGTSNSSSAGSVGLAPIPRLSRFKTIDDRSRPVVRHMT